MARKGIEKASTVIRLLGDKTYMGRFITYSRKEAVHLVEEIQRAGVPSRLITLPESDFGLANRYVVGVQVDDDMTPEASVMWKLTAGRLNLPLFKDLQDDKEAEAELVTEMTAHKKADIADGENVPPRHHVSHPSGANKKK